MNSFISVVNVEEHHSTELLEKLSSLWLLSFPSEGQLSIFIDSATFFAMDLPKVAICSETPEGRRSLLAPEEDIYF